MDTNKLLELMKQKKASMQRHEKTIKPQPGTNRFILLPGWREEERHIWFHDFGQHYIKDEAGTLKAVYPCNQAIFGESCSVCEGLSRALRASDSDETTAVLKEANATRRHLVNVLALDTEDPNTPQILEITPTVFAQFINLIEEWSTDILSDKEANVIVIERVGKGIETRYSAQVSPKKVAIPKSAMAKLNNLDEYVKMESEEQMRKALNAIGAVAGVPAISADRPKTLALAKDEIANEVFDPSMADISDVAYAKPSAKLTADLDAVLSDLG